MGSLGLTHAELVDICARGFADPNPVRQLDTNVRPGRREHARIVRIGAAPHDVIFPRCALVVHHGGAGTTQAP